MKEKLKQRLITYAKIDTQSDEKVRQLHQRKNNGIYCVF